jgi:capsular exopolysaccharide synthesis family protein
MDSGAQLAKPVAFKSMVTLSDEPSRSAEAIRALRTHVMARHVSEGHRALSICAASRGSGCTFVASNLAVALSQIGVNTLLLDADLRAPGIAATFGYKPVKNDLRTALSSPVNFNDCIERNVLPGLSILFSAGTAPNAQELLASGRFKSLMDFCLREFDATIVDTPPANRYSDARRISTVVGYSLIVAQRNKSHINDIKALAEHLRGDHATVIGTVLNEA